MNDLIPARVRAELLSFGIPASQHTLDGLADLFPNEFNIGAAGLDTEELAKALIHFAKQGIIAVPESGAETSIKKVEPGWHFCQFYRDSDQLLNVVAPYNGRRPEERRRMLVGDADVRNERDRVPRSRAVC